MILKGTLKKIKPEMKTKELYICLTQVSTSIYYLEVTAVLNLLIGGYKRSIATDYQENLIIAEQQLKNEARKWSRDYDQLSYMPQNHKKCPADL